MNVPMLDKMSGLLTALAGLAFATAVYAQAPATAPTVAGQPPSIAAPPIAPLPGAPAPEGGVEYMLGPEDIVEYQVLGTNDTARARIYTDGTIQTNLAGRVVAAGKTPRELATELSRLFKAGGFYAEPVVTVEVVGFASRYVTVLGSVAQPGLVPITRAFRLSEILARVGGARGDGADYLIIQPREGSEKRYNLDKIAAGGPEDDPVVQAGDKIFIPQAEQFFISGQIKNPGSHPLKSGMTIAQAIAKAGGLTESGTDKKVKVRRGGKMLKLKGDDPIEPEDVLTVGERLF
jgi:polysaccharide export outer membrane protein